MVKSKKGLVVSISIIAALLCIIGVLSYRLYQKKDFIDPDVVGIINGDQITALDNEYKERLALTKSNAETSNLNEEFAERWQKMSSEYYDLIFEIADKYEGYTDASKDLDFGEDLKQSLYASQNAWETYAQNRIDEERAALIMKYETGSIVPLLLSQFQYTLYRERTVELYNLYMNLSDQRTQWNVLGYNFLTQ